MLHTKVIFIKVIEIICLSFIAGLSTYSMIINLNSDDLFFLVPAVGLVLLAVAIITETKEIIILTESSEQLGEV